MSLSTKLAELERQMEGGCSCDKHGGPGQRPACEATILMNDLQERYFVRLVDLCESRGVREQYSVSKVLKEIEAEL